MAFELEKDWDKRPPARLTLDMLKEKEQELCKIREQNQKFELNIQGMGDKLEAIKTSLDEHKIQQSKDFDELKSTMTDFIKTANETFAPILVYRILVWAGGIAGAAVIVGLLTLIFRVIINLNK